MLTPAQWFAAELTKISKELQQILDIIKPMIRPSIDQAAKHDAATICHICEKEDRPFNPANKADVKIFDHCHLTGTHIF